MHTPEPVPVFLADLPEWRDFTERSDALAARLAETRAAEQAARDSWAEARDAYEQRVRELADGETTEPPGQRPVLDPTPSAVRAHAERRARDHDATRNQVLAALADQVHAAAEAWWQAERDRVRDHLAALTQDTDRLNQVLDQVRDVRRARDAVDSSRIGGRSPGQYAARTARDVTPDRLAAAGADVNPFALAPVDAPRGRIRRDNSGEPGLRRYTAEPVLADRPPSPNGDDVASLVADLL